MVGSILTPPEMSTSASATASATLPSGPMSGCWMSSIGAARSAARVVGARVEAAPPAIATRVAGVRQSATRADRSVIVGQDTGRGPPSAAMRHAKGRASRHANCSAPPDRYQLLVPQLSAFAGYWPLSTRFGELRSLNVTVCAPGTGVPVAVAVGVRVLVGVAVRVGVGVDCAPGVQVGVGVDVAEPGPVAPSTRRSKFVSQPFELARLTVSQAPIQLVAIVAS